MFIKYRYLIDDTILVPMGLGFLVSIVVDVHYWFHANIYWSNIGVYNGSFCEVHGSSSKQKVFY